MRRFADLFRLRLHQYTVLDLDVMSVCDVMTFFWREYGEGGEMRNERTIERAEISCEVGTR